MKESDEENDENNGIEVGVGVGVEDDEHILLSFLLLHVVTS